MAKKTVNKGVKEAIRRTGTKERPGSTYTLASVCGVTQPTVWHWLHKKIGGERSIQIERLTGVPRSDIRPDLFTK